MFTLSYIVVGLFNALIGTTIATLSLLIAFSGCLKPPATETPPPDSSPPRRATPVQQRSPLIDTHTGDSYKEPPQAIARALPSVMHIDHTDTIVPAVLSPSEQRLLIRSVSTRKVNCILLLRSMTKPPRARRTTPVGPKPPSVDRVVAYGTADEITFVEYDASTSSRQGQHYRLLYSTIGQLLGLFDDSATSATSQLDPLLVRLIKNGPRQFNFDYDELVSLLARATDMFADESSLLEVIKR